MVREVLVEKKEKYRVQVEHVLNELSSFLGIKNIASLRIINRYLVENITPETFEQAKSCVFSDPAVDDILQKMPVSDRCIGVESLPGQFDMRAASASECILLMSGTESPNVTCSVFYLIDGDLNDDDIAKIKDYLINPVECREASLDKPTSLSLENTVPAPEIDLSGFCERNEAELKSLIDSLGLAMNIDDLIMCQNYFRDEGRDPSITEIRVIDTYWSDHCRHTTFNTELVDVDLKFDSNSSSAFDRYLRLREEVGRENKPITLMDLGTIGARVLKKRSLLTDLEESEENNACTINIKCDCDGEQQDWLYFFKNETHNHPTEIEPFGGASTCIGGAIRDPLSGRAYCYQAMRVTGAGNPTAKIDDTLQGKLPQRKICVDAANGYSSYGNQIGLATGLVSEIYHEGYVAKRMEIGAVVGAAPKENVKRIAPCAGDKVVLLGGRTGRDGIGGATGSSKSHTDKSLTTCGSEVQKGNAPVERKLQRFFRNGEAASLIKKCNDFGAGGVSVAVGELSDSVKIDIKAIPKKYDGLNGTELAISESQERMACVVANSDVDKFLQLADAENLDATIIAEITDNGHLIEAYDGKNIVDIKRSFLDTFGAKRQTNACVDSRISIDPEICTSLKQGIENSSLSLNNASQRGLVERFDSTIGSGCVVFPLGGKYQDTKSDVMVSKLPTKGETTTVSGMAYGQDVFDASFDPYKSGFKAVLRSVQNLVCAGFDLTSVHLTFQEYFKKLKNADDWSFPLRVLLGALDAQITLGCAAIGGKDSMSGSFKVKSVPPTLVSFATAIGEIDNIVSNELKTPGDILISVGMSSHSNEERYALPYAEIFQCLHSLILQGKVKSCISNSTGVQIDSLLNATNGNRIGIKFDDDLDIEPVVNDFDYLAEVMFTIECESSDAQVILDAFGRIDRSFVCQLGEVVSEHKFIYREEEYFLPRYQIAHYAMLEHVYPFKSHGFQCDTISSNAKTHSRTGILLDAKPKVLIPVFPGTNCEYDLERAFVAAGAEVEIHVIKDMDSASIHKSIDDIEKSIKNSEILMLPGGFSGGDEPDGSAKFIASFFRNEKLADAIEDLVYKRDGLILGICNGFQALLKLGLLPYGHICDIDSTSATLTYNNIDRHQSKMVNTRVSSVLSPWLQRCEVGDIHTIPISHGEGKFVCDDANLLNLIKAGQIACQYCDFDGNASGFVDVNPNGSICAIEAISSPDGRILGKMGHSERRGFGLYKNIPGNKFQELFEGGVDYFKC